MGLLAGLHADLGYAGHALLRDCERHEVKFVVRLREGWKPKVREIRRGEPAREFLRGTDLDTHIEEGILKLSGSAIDLDAIVGRSVDAAWCRLVGVTGPKGWCWCLDETAAWSGPATRAAVHAATVSATLPCLVAHHHRLSEAPPPRKGAERTKPPIHPQMVARQLAFTAMRIAAALDLRGKRADDEWDFVAGLLLHQGTDPNWRSRPSVLDQLRGGRITPGKPRTARAASVRARRAK